MMKQKIMASLCAMLLAGTVAFASAPASVQDGQKQVYSRGDGSTLTIQYPVVTVSGNQAASQAIARYFLQEEQKAMAFFQKTADNGTKMTETKDYVVTLNNGKYLSFIDQGSLYFDKAAHPSSWKNGVTFDLETGRQVSWQEIIKPEDAGAFTLKEINNRIFLSKYTLSSYFHGLEKLPENYYLDKNRTIHFLFAQYEIAPYSTGIVDINMNKQAK